MDLLKKYTPHLIVAVIAIAIVFRVKAVRDIVVGA
jgi:hypothetical protein